MDQFNDNNDDCLQGTMSEPLMPAQSSLKDGHNTSTTGEFCKTFDDIDDLDLDFNQNELY